MWVLDIFWNERAPSLWHCVFFTNNFYASAAAITCWLQNVHAIVVVHFSVIQKSFVVLREHVSHWTNIKFFPMKSSLLLNISPHICFRAEPPSSSKMIHFLPRIHIFKFIRSYQRSPEEVPTHSTLPTINQIKTCCLKSIHNTIVCKLLATYSKV